jgi:hypothetical protein
LLLHWQQSSAARVHLGLVAGLPFLGVQEQYALDNYLQTKGALRTTN